MTVKLPFEKENIQIKLSASIHSLFSDTSLISEASHLALYCVTEQKHLNV